MILGSWKVFIILSVIVSAYLWHSNHPKYEDHQKQWGLELCEKADKTSNVGADLQNLCRNLRHGN